MTGPNPAPAPAPRPERILVVDDEPANLLLLQYMLEREGYGNLIATPDPGEALELYQALLPDLVLLDLNMPGLDGFAVMQRLRGLVPAGEFVPILVVTGDPSPESRLRALSEGAVDFVTKPFDRVEVLLRIRNLLHTRALHAAAREHNRRLEGLVAERTDELEVALRRAEAAGEAKSQFLAKMSHELRTPLTPLQGALEMLAEMELPERAARLLEMAAQNTTRMVSLVNDILFLQAVEQGETGVQREPVQLRALLLDLAAESEPRARARGLELRVEAPAAVPPVDTDPAKLAEVLRRLLDNALRFTDSGAVTLRLVTEGEPPAATRIEVQDTGAGIPRDRQRAVFEPFEQADNSSTRRYEGAGIGLTICRTLCALLGHRLELRSEPGAGATFSVVL